MKILVQVDGSERALHAVRQALRLRQEVPDAAFLLATVQETTRVIERVLAPGADVLERLSGAAASRALAAAQLMAFSNALCLPQGTLKTALDACESVYGDGRIPLRVDSAAENPLSWLSFAGNA